MPSDALSLVCTHLAMLARSFTPKSVGMLDDPEYVQSAVTAQNEVGVMPTRPHSRDILSELASCIAARFKCAVAATAMAAEEMWHHGHVQVQLSLSMLYCSASHIQLPGVEHGLWQHSS